MSSDQGSGATPPGDDLHARLYALSGRAFSLAQEIETSPALAPARKEDAMALFQEVDALREAVRAHPDRSLSQAMSEAIVDITYVLSGGTAPLSMRLAYHVRSREEQSPA